MIYHIYYDQRHQVSMYAETPIDAPNLQHIELELSDDDIYKLQHGYQGYVERDIISLR